MARNWYRKTFYRNRWVSIGCSEPGPIRIGWAILRIVGQRTWTTVQATRLTLRCGSVRECIIPSLAIFPGDERPSSQQIGTLPTAQGGSATFAISYYEESDARTLEATTVCEVEDARNERVLLPSQTGVAFASMGVKNLFFRPTSTPLPILIRTRSRDLSGPFEDTKTKMHEIEDFISELNTYALVRFADSRNR